MKRCSKCLEEKNDDHFYVRCNGGALRSRCKACLADDQRSYMPIFKLKNHEKYAARVKRSTEKYADYYRTYREKNAAKCREYGIDYYRANKDLVRRRHAQYASLTMDRILARNRKRQAAKISAVPVWYDHRLVNDMYAEAKYQQLVVDHIVPLQSQLVCGLHWEGNLQLLTTTENVRKGNHTWSDQW